MRIFETDVLVVGSGGAGLRAAIEAKRSDAKVILASKTPIGHGNCTTYSGGGSAAAIEGLSEKEHFEITMKTGRSINNENLVKVLVKDAPKELLGLRDFGVRLRTQRGSVNCEGKFPIVGLGYTKPLADTVWKMGIEVHEHTMILELIKEDNRIAGAMGLDFHKGEFVAFDTKAIILATGGGGALYFRTDNPIHTTGDGYALAFNLGLALQDMEFVQFYPLGTAEPNLPIHIVLTNFADEGLILNSKGENIPKKYGITAKPIAVQARDLLSRAITMEVVNGLGVDEAVFLDITKVAKERIEASYQKEMLMRTLHALERPIRIAPVCHHFMGGVAINPKCETAIEGLYAAGEVTGGIHGANRMGGNALSDIFVFGAIAGKQASQYTKCVEAIGIDQKTLKEKATETAEMTSYGEKAKKRKRPNDLMKEIKLLMWRKVGILRSEEKLREALWQIQEIKEEQVPTISAEKPRELLATLEIMNGLVVAEIVARSALHREESRGAHYRLDYPEQNDGKWLNNTIIIKRGAKPEITSRPTIDN